MEFRRQYEEIDVDSSGQIDVQVAVVTLAVAVVDKRLVGAVAAAAS